MCCETLARGISGVDEKDLLMEATKGVVVSLSHDAKQALLKDVMK